MNLNILEKVAREVKKSAVKPAEHKDVTSLSMQIAANLRASGTAANPAIPSQVFSAATLRWI